MDTSALRLAFGAIAIIAAIYLIWPQVAVWLDRVKQPVCARCRYPAAGIPSLTCPECGSDLRRVGILTPGMMMRRAPGPRIWLAAWSLAWAIAGVVLATTLSLTLDGRIRSTKNVPFRSVDDPALAVTFDVNLEGWREPPRDSRYKLTLTHASKTQAAGVIEFPWPEPRILSSSGAAAAHLPPGTTLNAATLTAWLRDTDLLDPVTSSSQLLDTIERLHASPYNMVGGWSNGPGWNAGGSSLSVSRFTPLWVHFALAGLWITLWCLGALTVMRFAAVRAARRAPPPPTAPLATSDSSTSAPAPSRA